MSTNVKILANSRKLTPTKINDTTNQKKDSTTRTSKDGHSIDIMFK